MPLGEKKTALQQTMGFDTDRSATYSRRVTSKISCCGAFCVRISFRASDILTMMKNTRYSSLLALIAGLVFAFSVAAQGESFSNPDVDYVFELPDAKWKLTVKPSATTPNVEYVYAERNDGHLEVRRLNVPNKAVMTDIIRDEEQKLQFLPGYVAGKEEPFSGFLNGTAFNFEFVRAGRPMIGRFYFLKAGENSIYVLRFTGYRDKLRSIRNQTDSIARTFILKKR